MVTGIRPRRNASTDIQPDNLTALASIYAAWQLEELRLFQVVDRIVDLFRQGQLPLRRGRAAELLHHYATRASDRMTEGERRELYARVFGAPGGSDQTDTNRDFDRLWLRFVSSVTGFAARLPTDLPTADVLATAMAPVRESARDLAINLSAAGQGNARFAAAELQRALVDFRELLHSAEVRRAFGARDLWAVVDRVGTTHLGGARDTRRFRTRGRAGAVILRWLADHADRLGDADVPILSAERILGPRRGRGGDPTRDPDDGDLVGACEQWLAAGIESER